MQRALRVHSCHPPRALLRKEEGGKGRGKSDFPLFLKFSSTNPPRVKTDARWMTKHNKRIFSRSTSSESADEHFFYWSLKPTVFSSFHPDVCVSSPLAPRRSWAHGSRADVSVLGDRYHSQTNNSDAGGRFAMSPFYLSFFATLNFNGRVIVAGSEHVCAITSAGMARCAIFVCSSTLVRRSRTKNVSLF